MGRLTAGETALVRVVSPYFVAGLVFKGDVCVEAAPIIKWAVHKRYGYLEAYFKRKGWVYGTIAS